MIKIALQTMPDNHLENLVPLQNLLRFLYHQSMYFVQVYVPTVYRKGQKWVENSTTS